MSRVLAYKCDRTGLLFEHEAEYKEHLRREAAIRRHERREAKKAKEWEDFVATATACSSFADLSQWFVDHGENLVKKCIRDSNWRGRRWAPGDGIRSMTFSRMAWSDCCSNSHKAPKGKPTNWWRTNELPKGYPGWTGRLRIVMTDQHNLGSEIFRGFPVHTGTGGGGHNGVYEYDVTLFAEEFPSLFAMEKMKGNIPSCQ